MAPIHAAVARWWKAVAVASSHRSSMRAAAWLVETAAANSSRLKRNHGRDAFDCLLPAYKPIKA